MKHIVNYHCSVHQLVVVYVALLIVNVSSVESWTTNHRWPYSIVVTWCIHNVSMYRWMNGAVSDAHQIERRSLMMMMMECWRDVDNQQHLSIGNHFDCNYPHRNRHQINHLLLVKWIHITHYYCSHCFPYSSSSLDTVLAEHIIIVDEWPVDGDIEWYTATRVECCTAVIIADVLIEQCCRHRLTPIH